MYKPSQGVLPRDCLSSVKPHRGLMVRTDSGEYHKYPVHLGSPNRAGFVPITRPLGVFKMGVIFLRTQETVQRGYYLVTLRDIYRRRIDARPCRKLTLEQATLALGGSLSELGIPEATESDLRASIQPRTCESAEDEELQRADMAFQAQIEALHALENT